MSRRVSLDSCAELVRRWQRIRVNAARSYAALKATERELEQKMGDAEVGTVDGEPAVRKERETKPGVDLERLRVEKPELWETYPKRFQVTRLKFPSKRDDPYERG